MRVLTIKQPWVGCIFDRGKDVENRSWSTSYRGPLVIHAGAARSRTDDAKEVSDGSGDAWLFGHLVGIVTLDDCVRDARSKWADADAWHWVLGNVRKFLTPIPAKGRLGLWTLDDTLHRAVQKQMEVDRMARSIQKQLHGMNPTRYRSV